MERSAERSGHLEHTTNALVQRESLGFIHASAMTQKRVPSDITEFKERHASLEKEIEEEERRKDQIEADIQILTKRLVSINEALAKKASQFSELHVDILRLSKPQVAERNECTNLIHETEAAYSKILESSQTLLAVLKRESAAISSKHKTKSAPS